MWDYNDQCAQHSDFFDHATNVCVFCFFPLAGVLADIKYGRYKTVICSLCCIILALVFTIGAIAVTASDLFLASKYGEKPKD